MRYHFFWDQPTSSIISFFYQFGVTLTVLGIALTLAIRTRRRVNQARVEASTVPADSRFDGVGFVSAIFQAAGVSGWTIVRATGPLANFVDPSRRELRLSAQVADGRTLDDLATAAQQAGHVVPSLRWNGLARLRVLVILGLKLVNLIAWLVLLAGALMLSPFLSDRGAVLYASTLLTLFLLQKVEVAASRRAQVAIEAANLDKGWTPAEKETFAKALQAARWVEIAATLPTRR